MAITSAPSANSRTAELSGAHPMDSSRLFMALLNLVHDGDSPRGQSDPAHLITAPVLRRLLSALHFRDPGILKHARRVGLISVGIAARLGWTDEDLKIMEISALLHDIGKIGIPDHILRKPGKLSPDEAEYIAIHHRVGLALLQACQVHPDVTGIISQSHGVEQEQGGPRNALSLGSRILAVADAYDSLTTQQSFRASYDRWEALQILEEQSGKQFDRNVVAALGRWLDSPEASMLADERSAEVSIHVNAPVDMRTRNSANQLCHVFHHLYLLESLYDAFYIVDANRQVLIWSSGASKLFGGTARDATRRRWNRQLVSPTHATTDPIEQVFASGQSVCHNMTVKNTDGDLHDVEVQTIPIQCDDGIVCGVVELICNYNESKLHRGQFRDLKIAATRDALTGVFNRGELERQVKEMYEAWKIDKTASFSVMFIDIDHFKSINDRYSHAMGDAVLTDFSRLLQDELYSGEIIGRYGGEEFVVLCPETDWKVALERAERLRRTLSVTAMASNDELKVTASFGIAEISAKDTLSSIFSRADAALYEAKRTGRNRTCISASEVEAEPKERVKRRGRTFLVHNATMVSNAAGDMLKMKLSAFIEKERAKIVKVDERHIELNIGKPALVSWGTLTSDKVPVVLSLEFSELKDPNGIGEQTQALMKIQIESQIANVADDLFQARANRILESLRAYMMGTEA